MRFCTLVLAITGALFTTGCAKVVSLNGFADDGALDPALLGAWQDDEGKDSLLVRQAGDHYAITYVDKSTTFKLEARLLEAGGAKLLDVVSTNEDPFVIPAHFAVRIWPEGNTLRLAVLDTDWFRERAVRALPSQTIDGRVILTAPGDAVRAVLTKYGADDRAYSDPELLVKAP